MVGPQPQLRQSQLRLAQTPPSNPRSMDRCIGSGGLGRTLLSGTTCPGAVGETTAPMAYKFKGDRSSGTVAASADEERGYGLTTLGLTRCGGLREQTGRHTLKDPVCLGP